MQKNINELKVLEKNISTSYWPLNTIHVRQKMVFASLQFEKIIR